MKQEKEKELWGNCDIEKDMSWNMYQILVNTAVSANLIGTICNFCIHGTELPTILCGVCLLMILIIGCAGWITQKVQLSVLLLWEHSHCISDSWNCGTGSIFPQKHGDCFLCVHPAGISCNHDDQF